ncbi:MAG: AI-2E family transporter, partial [Candidatus Subteraquimicrobiales bacterium]|nr:AI-2E family transporter [Candidatus Subteraquimicrobiales bacterium]
LILGVDYAVLLGFIVGILNIIPYLGPIVGGTLAVIVALLESPMLALWVIVAMVVVQIIDGSIVSPRIVGETVNLHPVLIVFSLLIGARLFGFIGLLLAIPVAAAAKVLIYHFLTKNELDKSILRKGEGKDAK